MPLKTRYGNSATKIAATKARKEIKIDKAVGLVLGAFRYARLHVNPFVSFLCLLSLLWRRRVGWRFLLKKRYSKIQENFTAKDLPEPLKDLSAVIWVDMESPTEDDERVLLDVFKFHPLTVEDCRENRHYPKIEEFEDYIYFIVHGVRAETSPERFNTIELDGFLGPNYVITYHHDMFRSINNVKQLLRTTPVACQRGPAFPAAPNPGPGGRFLLACA